MHRWPAGGTDILPATNPAAPRTRAPARGELIGQPVLASARLANKRDQAARTVGYLLERGNSTGPCDAGPLNAGAILREC